MKKPFSLRSRLLAASALFTTVALALSLLVIQHVLARFVTGQIDQRLDNKIVSLASQIETSRDGAIRVNGNADGPPFDQPSHGSFWWIEGPRNEVHTAWIGTGSYAPPKGPAFAPPPAPRPPSASPPGQETGATPPPAVDDRPVTMEGVGPGGTPIHIRAAHRIVGGTPVTILVAAPVVAIVTPLREAVTSIALSLAAMGAGLCLATLAQVRLGLKPLAYLRRQVEAVRSGASSALPTQQPQEVLPLVEELNALLAENTEGLVRARRHVANLAHGLKTPLATLSLAVDRLPEHERSALKDLLDTMDRCIRHHLGRARASALGGPARTRTPLSPCLHDLMDALGKIHVEKTVEAHLHCPDELEVACETQDVNEMLGNLLENAFKYCDGRVICQVIMDGRMASIKIADDGPGVSQDQRDLIMRPGERLDESGVPGFGFGLPIARELAELYGGSLTLASGGTGFETVLTLPAVR